MDLTEFLLARIAEDERPARAAMDRGSLAYRSDWLRDHGAGLADAAHIPRWNPARVLRECKAKRRIVERYVTCLAENKRNTADHEAFVAAGGSEFDEPDPALYTPIDTTRTTSPFETAGLAFACQSLGTAYADHPDYWPEWRP